jgi:hypothetical protein
VDRDTAAVHARGCIRVQPSPAVSRINGVTLTYSESSLWTQISLTALKLAALDPRWLFIAEDAARSVISMRCSTCKSLATSYEGQYEQL